MIKMDTNTDLIVYPLHVGLWIKGIILNKINDKLNENQLNKIQSKTMNKLLLGDTLVQSTNHSQILIR